MQTVVALFVVFLFLIAPGFTVIEYDTLADKETGTVRMLFASVIDPLIAEGDITISAEFAIARFAPVTGNWTLVIVVAFTELPLMEDCDTTGAAAVYWNEKLMPLLGTTPRFLMTPAARLMLTAWSFGCVASVRRITVCAPEVASADPVTIPDGVEVIFVASKVQAAVAE